ncbi:hypothetical protein [Streptomyces sp. CC208A]|uniref:hypothetical protein n=1 Tax=Streptomyces sp. CC208A TaxID=3044573 RepID=UPI0024A90D5D|nr:hypothetical protein [Streptomyces sp. CC208A]
MSGSVTDVLDRITDGFMVVLGLGCVWLGCWAVLRPRRPPEPVRGPVGVVRAWGLGFVLLGVALVVETIVLMTGGGSGWAADVIRWVVGPLVVGSIVAAFVARGRERHRARTGKGRRRA